MFKFDGRIARILDDAYQGSDVTKRRMANFDALKLQPAEVVLDIGCGPGFLTLEMSRAVGERGRIVGMDPSEAMRQTAKERCAERSNVEIINGSANEIPRDPGHFDKAVAVQVFEYLNDIPGALLELSRVLRIDGRLVIGDIHFDSLVWFSGHPERMSHVLSAWDRHLVDRGVPAILPNLLQENGFAVESVRALTIVDTSLRPDGLANMMLHLIEAFIAKQDGFSAEDARSWAGEQEDLATQGRFFFSCTHFVTAARNAGG